MKKAGQCWYKQCENKYILKIKIISKPLSGGKQEMEFAGCKEHFKTNWDKTHKNYIDFLLDKK